MIFFFAGQAAASERWGFRRVCEELPSALPVPAKESPRRLVANARAAVMDKMADQRSVRAEVHSAREGAGAARARQRASRRTKVAASELHRPPISMPRTVRWHCRAQDTPAPWLAGLPGGLPLQCGRGGGAEHQWR